MEGLGILRGRVPSSSSSCDPVKKIKDKTRAERTKRAKRRGIKEGIKFGKRESAGKIKEQDTLIKEWDQQIKEQKPQIKLLAAELLLEAANSTQCSEICSQVNAGQRSAQKPASRSS